MGARVLRVFYVLFILTSVRGPAPGDLARIRVASERQNHGNARAFARFRIDGHASTQFAHALRHAEQAKARDNRAVLVEANAIVLYRDAKPALSILHTHSNAVRLTVPGAVGKAFLHESIQVRPMPVGQV